MSKMQSGNYHSDRLMQLREMLAHVHWRQCRLLSCTQTCLFRTCSQNGNCATSNMDHVRSRTCTSWVYFFQQILKHLAAMFQHCAGRRTWLWQSQAHAWVQLYSSKDILRPGKACNIVMLQVGILESHTFRDHKLSSWSTAGICSKVTNNRGKIWNLKTCLSQGLPLWWLVSTRGRPMAAQQFNELVIRGVHGWF